MDEALADDRYELVETLLDLIATNRYAHAGTLQAELVRRRGWTQARFDATLTSLRLALVPEDPLRV